MITNNTIAGNLYYGIFCWEASPTVTNNNFVCNAEDGVYFAEFSQPSIVGNTFTQDGIWCQRMSGGAIKSNTLVGGVIRCHESAPSIEKNSITQGGVVGYKFDGQITNNAITGSEGPGISCTNSHALIANNTISGNDSGIYCESSPYSPSIINNTVVNNNRYGIYCSASSSPSVTNNIVAFSKTGIYKVGDWRPPTLSNNCMFNPAGTSYYGVLPGRGDIFSDPLLINTAAADLGLLSTSPCIDAGLNSTVGMPLFDFDGQGRIFGGRVDIGADEWWSAQLSLPDLKGAADGAVVSGDGASVTAAWPDTFYIEASSRANGIRVQKSGHGLGIGQAAAISGVMATTADGERVIEASTVSEASGEMIDPLIIASRSLGGAATADYSAVNATGQQGVINGLGVNNIGLLVKVSGSVTFVDPGGDCIAISDGSLLSDIDGHSGVRVSAAGLIPTGLEVGDFVTVTGVVSCSKSGSDLYPRVLARDPIQVHN